MRAYTGEFIMVAPLRLEERIAPVFNWHVKLW
jgi:hypothetical protein